MRIIHSALVPLLLALPFTPDATAQILVGGAPNPAHPGFHTWFDAGDGVNGPGMPIDGSAVTMWTDNTGNGHDLVRTTGVPNTQPRFVASGLNGGSLVRFDGDDYIWGDKVAEFGSLAGAKTILCVCKIRVSDGGYVFDSTSISGRNALFSGQQSNPMTWQIYAGNAATTAGSTPPIQQAQVHSAWFDTGANEYFIDGLSVGTSTEMTQSLDGLILGCRYSLAHFLDGDIAEVLVYDHALSVSDRQAVESYLAGRWIGAPSVGTNFCVSTPNSSGSGAMISGTGSASVASNDLSLRAEPVPNQPGLFFYGPMQSQLTFGNGFRCIGGTVGRLAVTGAAGGVLSHDLDITDPPSGATTITLGSTWNFQAWFRDPLGGGQSFNLSNGLELNFLP
ncbi:MAG: hypothetical protein ACI841_003018 [Planctomycetota bacterium]|jgi:hypothetical protein